VSAKARRSASNALTPFFRALAATGRPLPPTTRARVLARLARELLGDPSAGARRRELIDEAVTLARIVGSPGTIAEVLDCRLQALWDPAAAHERLTTASEIVEQARRAGDAVVERARTVLALHRPDGAG
jgi:hypothetical protein